VRLDLTKHNRNTKDAQAAGGLELEVGDGSRYKVVGSDSLTSRNTENGLDAGDESAGFGDSDADFCSDGKSGHLSDGITDDRVRDGCMGKSGESDCCTSDEDAYTPDRGHLERETDSTSEEESGPGTPSDDDVDNDVSSPFNSWERGSSGRGLKKEKRKAETLIEDLRKEVKRLKRSDEAKRRKIEKLKGERNEAKAEVSRLQRGLILKEAQAARTIQRLTHQNAQKLQDAKRKMDSYTAAVKEHLRRRNENEGKLLQNSENCEKQLQEEKIRRENWEGQAIAAKQLAKLKESEARKAAAKARSTVEAARRRELNARTKAAAAKQGRAGLVKDVRKGDRKRERAEQLLESMKKKLKQETERKKKAQKKCSAEKVRREKKGEELDDLRRNFWKRMDLLEKEKEELEEKLEKFI
jgi:hypothetical protein